MRKILSFLIITLILSNNNFCLADNEIFEVEIVIKEHKFEPPIVEVPAGRKIRLTIRNLDDTIEEFDSVDLKREKIIPGNSYVHIILAPLKAGIYDYIGEFNADTAKGCIIVRDENR